MRVLSILLFLLVFGVTTDAKYQYYNGRLHPTSSKTKNFVGAIDRSCLFTTARVRGTSGRFKKIKSRNKKAQQQVTALEVLTKRLKNFFFKNF